MFRWPLTALTLAVSGAVFAPIAAQEIPSFEDVLGLSTISNPQISPDGQAVAYQMRTTDWEENSYDTEIWLVRRGEEPFRLTRTADGSSTSARWSPNGHWLGFLADRGDGTQVYVMRPQGGEARQLTSHEGGVSAFRWAPSGDAIAYLATEPETREHKQRAKQYGDFERDDAEYRLRHLWSLELAEGVEAIRLTEGEYTVTSAEWSPDGSKIAFAHQPNPLINSFTLSDISVLDVASGDVTRVVARPGSDGGPRWSPDGEWLLFATADGDSAFYLNRELAIVRASGGAIAVLTEDFDENMSPVAWTERGIWFTASIRMARHLYVLDPETRRVQVVATDPEMIGPVSFTLDGRTAAMIAASRTSLNELYLFSAERYVPERLTDMTAAVEGWSLGGREVIEWTSEDGATIEGVLFKPSDYDPTRRYPLLVVIHGGPTGTSRPTLVSSSVYPVMQWLAKGAVVMMPNYRGSAGYGEAFRSLNVQNLGVGDAWDVMSGVQYLVDEGIAHPDSLGAMGWSQGGYISAFLTTTTNRFKAVSVGAGISNWVTYYVNTDIHPFTRHYLQATPWSDPEVYAKTSPMTYIAQAETPTLIQHGEFDRRVPIPNAYELLQGLRDMGVEAELIVYKRFGHGISRPKERLAATWHNWQWFGKHIWNEDIELPLDLDEEETSAGGR